MVKYSRSPKIASLKCLHNILKNKLEMKLIFLHADKHQTFLQVDSNTLSIKVLYKGDIIIIDGHEEAFSKNSKKQACNSFLIK